MGMSESIEARCARYRAERDCARQDAARLRAELEGMRDRLMPEGLSWPVFEDGEPFAPGDDGSVEFFGDGIVNVWINGDHQHLTRGERVRRPAVLAADGEPLEVGETVWHVDGRELTVTGLPKLGEYQGVAVKTGNGFITTFDPCLLTHQRPVLDAEGNRIEPAMDVWGVCEGDDRGVHAEKLHVESIGKDGLVTCSPFNSSAWIELESSELYVHKPVLDADGVPIHEGDTVWCRVCGGPLTVSKVSEDGIVYVDLDRAHTGDDLTHTKPEQDSWERIEEVATIRPSAYCNDRRLPCEADPDPDAATYVEAMARDIVRRARALAERGK